VKTSGSPEVAYPAIELDALQRAGKHHVTRRFGRFIMLILLVTPIALALAPWQQNLAGEGRVIEFDPLNRPMPLQARTSGIVHRWHVVEGQQVEVGDPIVDLIDNDPDILARLQEELAATERKRDAAIQKRDQYEMQIESAEQARQAAMQYADDEIASSMQSVTVAEQALTVAEEKFKLAQQALTMWQGLVADRIGSGFDLQKAQQENNVAAAEVKSKQAAVAGAKANLRAKRSARQRIERSEQVKVQDAKAPRPGATATTAPDCADRWLCAKPERERSRRRLRQARADGRDADPRIQ
jgi:membrane fusion protein, adhesin transport system